MNLELQTADAHTAQKSPGLQPQALAFSPLPKYDMSCFMALTTTTKRRPHRISGRRKASKLSHFLILSGLVLPLSAAQKKPAVQPREEIATALKFLHWTPPAAAPISAFVNVNVLPMDQDRVYPNQTIVVRAGRIATIGPAESTPIPPHALRIDGKNKYLMPGLVDMRVHVYNPAELLLYLANGITTVRSMDSRPQVNAWRNRIYAGTMLGPTIYTSGPTIHRADSVIAGKRLILEQRRAEYEVVELYEGISAAGLQGIGAASRVSASFLCGHINSSVGLKGTLATPQFLSLEHVEQIARALFKDNADTPDADIAQAAAAIRTAGVRLIPSLVSYGSAIQELEDLPRVLSQPEFRYLPPWARREWSPPNNFYLKKFGKEEAPVFRRNWNFQKRIVSVMRREGVPILLGTDAMTVGTVPGFSVLQEMAILVEIGFKPFEALQAATRSANGWFLHQGGEFGTVTPGGRADFTLLDANPLDNIQNVSRISGVMVRGRWLPQAQLQKMIAALPAAYAEEEKFLTSSVQSQPEAASKYLVSNDPYHKLTNQVMLNIVMAKGVNALQQVYSRVQQVDPKSILIEENTVNDLGDELLGLNRTSDAIEVFRFNMKANPASANVYDSLAQAYLKSGNGAEAIRYYKEALRVDPNSRQAREALERLEGKEAGK